MKIAIVGGGIGGLGLALALHARGLACDVYESVPEVREIGVGITLLPHAMRELAALGLQPALEAEAIENLESVFFNRYGQFIYREPRGRHAGYSLPELGIHRGKLDSLRCSMRCWGETRSTGPEPGSAIGCGRLRSECPSLRRSTSVCRGRI